MSILDDVGRYKTEAIVKLLRQVNPWIKLRTDCVCVTETNVKDLFAEDDIICEAFDNPDAKAVLVNGILEYFPEKKIVAASGLAGYESSNLIHTRRVSKNFYLCGDEVTQSSYGKGLMAPRAALCAAHEANMITRLLLGEVDE